MHLIALLMISIVVQCNRNCIENKLLMISMVVQCNRRIALLMKSILVQCIRIELLMISIVVQCNRNTLAMHWK